MYIDRDLLVSDQQDIGAGGGSQESTYSIDLKAARKVWGGHQLYMIFVIDEDFADSTSINFHVVTDTVATLASPTYQISTGAITIANLTAGRAPIVLPIGSAIGTEEQYLGAYYTEAGSSSSAGKVTAFVAIDPTGNP